MCDKIIKKNRKADRGMLKIGCPRCKPRIISMLQLIKNNMKTAVKILITFGFASLLSNNVGAQEKNDSSARAFQLTLVTPLGTNGVESGNKTNNFSINIFAGYNGGLKGVELGGFANILKGDMDGAQFAGYANVNLKTGKGFQGAGFLNYNHLGFNGAQLSGYANVVLSGSKGFQGAGFANVVKGSYRGVQVSGFASVVADSIDGFQGAGFSNYSKGNTKGQIAGFANFNIGNGKGIQLSGFSNINTERTEGVQVSGFFNYTKVLKGLQLGAFNYVDSLEKGASIGIISFVRNGYHKFEISSNESMNGVLSYKTGTNSFYNILSIGGAAKDDKIYWGWGYGIGTIVPLKEKFDLNFEATCFQINEDEWAVDRLNLHNRINALVSVRLSENLTVFGGPSWNVLVSDIKDKHGNTIKSDYAPWSTFNKTYNNDTNVKMYPGFSLGVRF